MTEFEADVIARLDRIEQALAGALQRRVGEAPRSASSGGGSPVVKFGRDKGRSLADVDDLTWYRAAIARSVADPDKAQYRDRNIADLAAIDAEIARRNGATRPPPASEPEAPFPGDDDIPF